MIKGVDFTSFGLTLELAIITTSILLIIGIPIAYYIAYTKYRYNVIVESIIAMPLVLPPSVLGFYLLLLLNKNGLLGSMWESLFGYQLAFHFDGLVVASVIFSFPFMVHPLIAGFRSVNRDLIEASYTLGKSKIGTLFNVILPNMKSAILTGLVISFAHTVGEFGVVLMIGGSIEGETKVVSITIYDAVERLDYFTAHIYAGLLFGFSFIVLMLVYYFNKKIEMFK